MLFLQPLNEPGNNVIDLFLLPDVVPHVGVEQDLFVLALALFVELYNAIRIHTIIPGALDQQQSLA